MSKNLKQDELPIHVALSLLTFLLLAVLACIPIVIISILIWCTLYIVSWPIYRLKGKKIKFIDIPTLKFKKQQQSATLSNLS